MNATRAATVAAVFAAAAAVPAGPSQAPAVPVTPVAAAWVAVVAPAPPHVHDHASHSHHRAKPAAKRARPRPAVTTRPPAKPSGVAPVWDGRAFETPEAAVRFLVQAYNAHADGQLKHVTTPAARSSLILMRDYAPVLRLKACTRVETGAYDCELTHNVAATGRWDGWATVRIAPAARPGWYMTILADCGDGESA